jgi:hypothetical protein
VAGKHEPPSKRSFYFSLATSTLRAIIVAAFLAAGVLGISRFFEGNPTQEVATQPTATSPTPTTEATPTPPRTPSSPSPAATHQPSEVTVQVRNGTSITGLAGSVTEILEGQGYVTETPTNAEVRDVTIVYFQPEYEADARSLQQRYFPGATLERVPGQFPQNINVFVILGSDYNPT